MRNARDPITVRTERDRGVALVTLDRPAFRNAWCTPLETAYYETLGQLDADDEVRAIVVTGAGHTFCPGADPASLARLVERGIDLTGRLAPSTPIACRKPLVAAINGACAGIGLVQALLCDIRFAASSAVLSTSFTRRGLAGEYGIAWLLPRIVGHANALDLLLSGRRVAADEAATLGLVHHVIDDDRLLSHALDYARDLVENCSPAAMALVKAQVWADQQRGYDAAIEQAFTVMQAAQDAGDAREGLASLTERRKPQFSSLAGLRPQEHTDWPVPYAGQAMEANGPRPAHDGTTR